VMNGQYETLAMAAADAAGSNVARGGIVKGLYKFRAASKPQAKWRAQLFGSGAILPEVIKAQEILGKDYNVGADVWSVTSYVQLYRDGHAADRRNMVLAGETPTVPYVT